MAIQAIDLLDVDEGGADSLADGVLIVLVSCLDRVVVPVVGEGLNRNRPRDQNVAIRYGKWEE